jgi:hypothetical protein
LVEVRGQTQALELEFTIVFRIRHGPSPSKE